MTIIEIEVLLHYFYSPSDHPRIDVPAVQDAVKMLCKAGMLEEKQMMNGARYRIIQEAAQPYINKITSIPLPKLTQVWVIPETK
jgi:hypothetical protein